MKDFREISKGGKSTSPYILGYLWMTATAKSKRTLSCSGYGLESGERTARCEAFRETSKTQG